MHFLSFRILCNKLAIVIFTAALLGIACLAQSRVNGYSPHMQDTVSQAFDAVIGSLQGKEKQISTSAGQFTPVENAHALNNNILSFVNKLDKQLPAKVKKTYAQDERQEHTKPINVRAIEEPNPTQIVLKTKPKEFINTSLDMINKSIDISDQDFYAALDRFKHNRDFGQLALQHVIDLLDAELNLVRHLAVGHTGAAVQEALDDRNGLLQRTIPLAVTLYDTILTVATHDSKHNATLNNRTNNGKRLQKALTAYDQKIFLSTIENKIEQYKEIMKTLQYNVTVDTTLAYNSDIYDEHQKVINKYLQIVT